MSDTTGWRLDRLEKDLENLGRDLRLFPSLEAYRERQEAINREFRDVKADLEKLEADTGQRLVSLRAKVDALEEAWQNDALSTLKAQLEARRAGNRWAVTTVVSVAALILTIISLVLRG